MDVLLKAGTLPYRSSPSGQIDILTIGRQNRDHWILPMGRFDPGETAAQAAQRETQEEAGVDVQIGPYLGEIRWVDKSGNTHKVAFYLAEYRADTEWPERNERCRQWVRLEEAEKILAEDFQTFVRSAKQHLHSMDHLT